MFIHYSLFNSSSLFLQSSHFSLLFFTLFYYAFLIVEKRDPPPSTMTTRSCCCIIAAPQNTRYFWGRKAPRVVVCTKKNRQKHPLRRQHRVVRVSCAENDDDDENENENDSREEEASSVQQQPQKRNGRRRRQPQADSTDAVATFLTRRFGLKGGVAWLGLLTFGVVSEQAKTRWERREEKANTRAVAKDARRTTRINEGTSYEEIVEGGGEYVQQGFLCGAHVSVKNLETNETVFDTRTNNRPIGFVYSKTRPPPVLPRDVNESFSDDRYIARNGTRRVFETTSGDDGLTFTDGSYVAPNVRVEIDFEFTKVSIPPS